MCSNAGMLQVVAAVFERDSRVLICQRTAAQAHPLEWEFPGGKVEPGETPEAALTRELQEELGITHAQGQEITRYQFTYPGKQPIELIFFRVSGFEGEPENLIFQDMRWEPTSNLERFDFVLGDRNFLARYAAGEF
jgi:8-oxo-dGTP diphosphatase